MNKLLKKLNENKMSLIASLPENSYELAKIAWECGVDAIKVHVNVFHRASQNTFGSVEENKELFKRIIQDSPVPVGIVLGENPFLAESLIEEIVALGFDFISLYGHHTPASFIKRNDINNFFAVNSIYSPEELRYIATSFVADILELSVVEPEGYGERLSGRDIAKYQYIATHANVPCVVPTQKVVYPSDMKVLHKTGVKGIMVGAISYGKTAESIRETLIGFRKEIDAL